MEEEDHKKFSEIDPKMIKKMMNMPKPIVEKLVENINYKLHLQKQQIMKQAFKERLLTEKEYNENYKDMFYDDYGSDSFPQYVNAVMNAESDCFVTINKRMLKRKEELKKRFGLEI